MSIPQRQDRLPEAACVGASARATRVLQVKVDLVDDLIGDHLRAALETTLVPLDRAVEGDLVAVSVVIRHTGRYGAACPIRHFLVLGSEPDEATGTGAALRPVLTSSWSLLGALQARAAVAAMAIQEFWSTDPLDAYIRDHDPGDGEDSWWVASITADGLLVVADNHIDEICDGRYCDDEIDQDVVDHCARFFVSQPGTAHGRMRTSVVLERMRGLLSLCPMPEREGEPKIILEPGPPGAV